MTAYVVDMDAHSVLDLDARVDLALGPDGHDGGTDTKIDVYEHHGEGQ
jgi:hypothetical protein